MPVLTRYFIKAALLYLVLALAMSLWMAANPAVTFLRATFFHMLVVGWITQLIFGVAYWMFPKYTRQLPRGNAGLAWMVFICLNLGLMLRLVGEPLVVIQPELNLGWLLAVSAVLQLAAGWGYIALIWTRVKER
jgi:hypothetical protein